MCGHLSRIVGVVAVALVFFGGFAAQAKPTKAKPAVAPAPVQAITPPATTPNCPTTVQTVASPALVPTWPEPIWLLEGGAREAGSPFASDGGEGTKTERRGGRPSSANAHSGHANNEIGGKGASNARDGGGFEDSDATAMSGMSFGRGPTVKTLTLRAGAEPLVAKGETLANSSVQILSNDGERSTAPLINTSGASRANVEVQNYGFYAAAVTRRAVHGGFLDVQIAQAELLKGAMAHGGHSDHDPKLFKATMDDKAPFELVREHGPDEKLWTTIRSGEKASFLVRSRGAPVAGAQVTFVSQEGWRKAIVTDANGRAEFTLVRDYFPDWADFNRRRSGVFLVWAEKVTPEAGVYDGQDYAATRYQASLSGRYYPSPADYESYGYGVGIVVFVTAFFNEKLA